MMGLLISAAVGGAAALVAALLTQRLAKSKANAANAIRIGSVVASVVATQALYLLLSQREANQAVIDSGLQMFGREEPAKVYAEGIMKVIENPKFRERTAGTKAGEGRSSSATAQLVASGLKRLSLAEAETVLDVRREMADLSPALCAGFWTGAPPKPDEVSRVLHALSAEHQLQFAKSAPHAAELELAGAPVHPTDAAALQAGMAATERALGPEEKRVFTRAVTAGVSASASEGCVAFKILADQRRKLPSAQAEAIVRAVLFAESPPPASTAR